jgi:bacterioferritin-associated ferredoxin
MIVCICRVVTESRVRAAVAAGAKTADEVESACGAGGDCGACREEIEGIIIEQRADGCANCPNARRDIATTRAA